MGKNAHIKIFKVKSGNICFSFLSELEAFTGFFDFTSFDSEPQVLLNIVNERFFANSYAFPPPELPANIILQ